MCAFDLLASVAGKLLLDPESSPSSSNTSSEKDQCTVVNQDIHDGNKALKVEHYDQRSCDRIFMVSEQVPQGHGENHSLKESLLPQSDDHSGFTSVITTSNCSERLGSDKMVNGEIKNEMGSFVSKIEVGSSAYRESDNCKLDGEAKILVNDTGKVLIGNDTDMCSSEDPVVWDGEPPAIVSSDSSAKAPFCGDHNPQSSCPASRDDIKVVSRDDDENSSGCTHSNSSTKYFKRAPRIGDRRIRKILASKYWKVSPRLKDETFSNPGMWFSRIINLWISNVPAQFPLSSKVFFFPYQMWISNQFTAVGRTVINAKGLK